MLRAGINEVGEAGAAIKFGKEDSGVGLGLGAFDPLEAGFDTAVFTTSLTKNSASITAQPHSNLL